MILLASNLFKNTVLQIVGFLPIFVKAKWFVLMDFYLGNYSLYLLASFFILIEKDRPC